MTPLGFLGRSSPSREGAPSLEIWEVVNILFPENRRDFKMIGALDRRKKMWVGTVDMRRKRSTIDDFAPCRADFERVSHALKLDPSIVFQISGSSLLPAYHGLGIGVAMYLGAAMVAFRDGAAIAADACFFSDTSEMAKRVWRSRAFNERVVRSGLVAAWKA